MISAVSCAAAALRSTQNTCAPSRANVTAVALPLPQPGPIEPAPTTMATLPLRRSIVFSPALVLPGKLDGRNRSRQPGLNGERASHFRTPFALATTRPPAYAG